MEESIFTKIIKGEIPCYKVYEDDKVLAFLDMKPATAGHTLLIPKQQIDHLWDAEDEIYMYLMEIAKRIAKRQRSVLNPKRIGMLVEGFGVPHAHIHIFPLNNGVDYTLLNRIPKPTDDEFAEMAEKLKF